MAGTGQTSSLGHVSWGTESSFADTSTDSVTTRVQVRDESIDVSGLEPPLVERGGVFQHLNDGDFDIPGPFGTGTFSFTMDLYGHGSATNGELTETTLSQLLGHAWGNLDSTVEGGNCTSNSSDAEEIVSTEMTTISGAIVRVGALGDGRAEGQATVIDDPGNTADLLVALPAAPTTADDVFAMLQVFPVSSVASGGILTSDGSSSNNTLRFQVATANHQYVCRGCAITGVELTNLSPGDVPQVRFTVSTVAWDAIDVDFPSSLSTSDKAPAPVSAGSFVVQDRGTVTRTTDVVRDFSISIGEGIVPIMGTGGATDRQTVTGWRRVPARTTLNFSVESQDATTSPTWWSYGNTDPNSQTAKQVLYTLSVQDGRAVALYFPRCKPVEATPTQTSIDGINYVNVRLEALTDPDNSTELSKSAFRLGLG